jgi:hypothetical protein
MLQKIFALAGHRANVFLVLALVAVAAVLAVEPQLLAVSWYKGFLVFAGANAGYWVDRVLFPYARPDRSPSVVEAGQDGVVSAHDLPFMAWCMLRRAIIVVGAMVCVAFGA